jgi:hypothetical protein
MNAVPFDHTLEVCDAILWQLTVSEKRFVFCGINALYHSGCSVSGIVVLSLSLLAGSGMNAI